MKLLKWQLALAGLALAGTVQAQSCQAGIEQSSPDSDFTVTGGTVTHLPSGLMWLRCAAGQSWDGSACVGTPAMVDWQEALLLAEGLSEAGYSDWRMPNKNELASLIETSCVEPAANVSIFPGFHPASHWTSSPSNEFGSNAWAISFDVGYINYVFKTSHAYVRMVRDMEP